MAVRGVGILSDEMPRLSLKLQRLHNARLRENRWTRFWKRSQDGESDQPCNRYYEVAGIRYSRFWPLAQIGWGQGGSGEARVAELEQRLSIVEQAIREFDIIPG